MSIREFQNKKKVERSFNIIKVGLSMDRDKLYQRINARMDKMIEDGLFDEARRLYPYKNHNALQTVGYQEIFDYFDGKYDREEAIRLLKQNSRRYAKRQLTWFQKDKAVKWFDAIKKKGWHEVRLVDASGEPLEDKNAPKDDFEKAAIKAIKAGKAYHDEVVTREGKQYLRAATIIPVVSKKCTMCHPNYEKAKEGEAIGALVYTLPIE